MKSTNLGRLIKTLRIKHNMRQEDLAQQLNISVSAVSKWENNKNLPDMNTLQGLSHIFNISLDDLCHPEETLARLNQDDMSNITEQNPLIQSSTSITADTMNTKKTCTRKKLLIGIAIFILMFLAGIGVYTIFQDKSEISIRPYGYRTTEDQIYGEVYEMGCIYSGNIEKVTLSDPYVLALGDDWKSNTTISPDIHYMRISFYQTEIDSRNWANPDKTIYLYR